MRYLLLVLLVVLFGQGCARKDCQGHYTYDSDDWTEAQVEALYGAQERWFQFTGYQVITLTEGKADTCHILPVPEIPGPRAGVNVGETGNIEVEGSRISSLELIVTHEMGHGLGFEHVDDPQAMMAPAMNLSTQEFRQADLEECQALGVCR